MYVGATISACGRYRYELARGEGEPSICWIMLNPSTADASRDDPTIRRVIGFSRRWGFATAVVVNLFAWRATRPEELLSVEDPVGPDNDRTVRDVVGRSDVVVLAHGSLPPDWRGAPRWSEHWCARGCAICCASATRPPAGRDTRCTSAETPSRGGSRGPKG